MQARVYCTFQVEGMHSWPGAPREHLYLASPHRHVFHFRVEWHVSDLDREVEFIVLKRSVRNWAVHVMESGAAAHWSCERWAKETLEAHDATRVEVSEDGENGAVVSV